MSQPAVSSKSGPAVLNNMSALRHPAHKFGARVAAFALSVSFSASLAFYFGWVKYAGKRDADYINNHDPYARMKEICSYPGPARYMVSCPKELLKKAIEKGMKVGSPSGPFIPVEKDQEETVESAE